VLAPSQIGLKIYEGAMLGEGVAVKRAKRTSVNEEIATQFYFRDKIKDCYNALRLDFAARFAVEFRAYDEGVAYRFVTNFKRDFKIANEVAEFAFAKDYKGYFAYSNRTGTRKDNYFTSFEGAYNHIELSKIDSTRVSFSPAIVEVDNYKVCILESDVEHYPGMFLSNRKGAKAVYGEFAPMPDIVSAGGYRKLQDVVESRKPYIAECKAATKTPWRIVLVTDDANTLLDNDMVYRLASPSRLEDTSWIKPGKVAWEWWNHWGLTGVPFKAGINTETYNYYTDFAAKYADVDPSRFSSGEVDAFWLSYENDWAMGIVNLFREHEGDLGHLEKRTLTVTVAPDENGIYALSDTDFAGLDALILAYSK
jgi:alpha-glucosidase